MRKELVAGVVGTVCGGVILWILEPYKERFPEKIESFFDYLWAPVAFPRVATFVFALIFGFLVVEFWIASLKKRRTTAIDQKEVDATRSVKRPLEFSKEEVAVLHVILSEDLPVGMPELRDRLAFSPLRLRHAVDTLIERGVINLNEGDYFLTKEGRAVVIDQNLDTIENL